MLRRKFLSGLLASLATAMVAAPGAASADDNRSRGRRQRNRGDRRRRPRVQPKPFYREGPDGRSSGQDRARRALREGQVLPLGDILGMVRRRFPGKVLDVNLVRERRGFVYYLKVLDRRGRVSDVAVDGRSGRILGVRGRGG
jgi:uncharacterized membrane protein YkoI